MRDANVVGNIARYKRPQESIIAAVEILIYCWPQPMRKNGTALFSSPAKTRIYHEFLSFGNE